MLDFAYQSSNALSEGSILGEGLVPFYIAILMFATLYSVSSLQVIFYYQHCWKDHAVIKWIILGLWLLDTGLFGATIYAGWFTLTRDPGVSQVVVGHHKFWIVELCFVLGGANNFFIDMIMIWITWNLIGRKIWVLPITILPTIAAIAGFVTIAFISFRDPLATQDRAHTWAIQLPFFAHAFVDLLLCVAVAVQLISAHMELQKYYSSNLDSSSDSIVRFLSIWFIVSGFLVCALVVASVTLLRSISRNTAASVISKLMFVSLLGLLNTSEYRKKIRTEQAEKLIPVLSRNTIASFWSPGSMYQYNLTSDETLVEDGKSSSKPARLTAVSLTQPDLCRPRVLSIQSIPSAYSRESYRSRFERYKSPC